LIMQILNYKIHKRFLQNNKKSPKNWIPPLTTFCRFQMQFLHFQVQIYRGFATWLSSNSKATLKPVNSHFKLSKDKTTPAKSCVSCQMIVAPDKRHLALLNVKVAFHNVFSSF
jgi:hypothetical protein